MAIIKKGILAEVKSVPNSFKPGSLYTNITYNSLDFNVPYGMVGLVE